MHSRRLKQLDSVLDRPCGLCPSNVAVVAESRTVRRGLDWVNPLWDAESELYEICAGCGARRELHDQQSAA